MLYFIKENDMRFARHNVQLFTIEMIWIVPDVDTTALSNMKLLVINYENLKSDDKNVLLIRRLVGNIQLHN